MPVSVIVHTRPDRGVDVVRDDAGRISINVEGGEDMIALWLTFDQAESLLEQLGGLTFPF